MTDYSKAALLCYIKFLSCTRSKETVYHVDVTVCMYECFRTLQKVMMVYTFTSHTLALSTACPLTLTTVESSLHVVMMEL